MNKYLVLFSVIFSIIHAMDDHNWGQRLRPRPQNAPKVLHSRQSHDIAQKEPASSNTMDFDKAIHTPTPFSKFISSRPASAPLRIVLPSRGLYKPLRTTTANNIDQAEESPAHTSLVSGEVDYLREQIKKLKETESVEEKTEILMKLERNNPFELLCILSPEEIYLLAETNEEWYQYQKNEKNLNGNNE